MTTTSVPLRMGPRSALRTTPCRMRESGPMVTSPVSTAVEATDAEGSILATSATLRHFARDERSPAVTLFEGTTCCRDH